MHPVTRAIVEAGLTRKTVDAFDAFHALARVRRVASELFAGCDALLVPTAPFCPTLAEVAADPFGPNTRLGTFTNFVNLCDMAAIAVPAGFGADGLPVGVTVLGPAWSEGRLAAIADRIHRAFASGLAPPGQADDLAGDETALFCIGAHMAGLPLNPQIAELGGRFLRDARTLPSYCLHALGNRPGLARREPGAAILGEVWALPTAAIGALLALVPPPLGFGTVALEDGPCIGFLAEAQAMEGTPDITAYGGWRAWLAARGTFG
jgi:allophanate hydrolase